MGRQIISDGVVYFYSNGSKLESPITITPYLKDNEEIDPYIFNYDTSVWTNLVTGETFEPIFRTQSAEGNDGSYTLQTRETGILIFAKKPEAKVLTPITNLILEDEIYSIDMEQFMQEQNLSSIERIDISNQDIVEAYRGEVSNRDTLQLRVLQSGVTEITIVGVNQYGERVSYTYIINVTGDIENQNRHEVELKRDGWNLIAICQNINATDINMTNITEIQSQNGESIYTGEWAEWSNLDELKAGYGYWVKGNKGVKFDTGVASGTLTIPLQRDGWNLMASCQERATSSIDMSSIQEIQSQDGDSLYTGEWADYSTLDKLLDGYGYWIRGDRDVIFNAKK
jgi:hypothetical protein